MTELSDLCTNLQSIWHEQIPLSKAMDMHIVSFANDTLTCRASLAPNVNVHGTAFAGSLYAIQALTGWGMMYLQLQLHELDASIVIANGNIDYTKPVAEHIVVRCQFGQHAKTMQQLEVIGKARFQLSCEVLVGDGSCAGRFTGDYAVRLNR